MFFDHTPEQKEYRQQIRRFVDSNWPIESIAMKPEMRGAIPENLLRQAAQDLGILGIGVPEACGGTGFTLVERAIAVEEFGRALVDGGLLSTCALAIPSIIASSDDEAIEQILPALISGQATATVVLPEQEGDSSVTAVRENEGVFRLDGFARYVMNPDSDNILVFAECEGRLGLFKVKPGHEMRVDALECVDATRRHGGISFVQAEGRMIGAPDSAKENLNTICYAKVLLASEAIGAAERCLELTVEYARTRQQFGVPIGSFQVIKHKCAEMLLLLEPARSAAHYAAWAFNHAPQEIDVVANLAKAECADAFYRIASHAVQIHGGVGITWEHPISWFFRRAVWSREFLGSYVQCNELIGEAIGL